MRARGASFNHPLTTSRSVRRPRDVERQHGARPHRVMRVISLLPAGLQVDKDRVDKDRQAILVQREDAGADGMAGPEIDNAGGRGASATVQASASNSAAPKPGPRVCSSWRSTPAVLAAR
jgi:hypothetical protein